MFTDAALRDMIFFEWSAQHGESRSWQHKIKEIDPSRSWWDRRYETFGEGFKQFPDKNEIHAE